MLRGGRYQLVGTIAARELEGSVVPEIQPHFSKDLGWPLGAGEWCSLPLV